MCGVRRYEQSLAESQKQLPGFKDEAEYVGSRLTVDGLIYVAMF
jgi:hypothetical protein